MHYYVGLTETHKANARTNKSVILIVYNLSNKGINKKCIVTKTLIVYSYNAC